LVRPLLTSEDEMKYKVPQKSHGRPRVDDRRALSAQTRRCTTGGSAGTTRVSLLRRTQGASWLG